MRRVKTVKEKVHQVMNENGQLTNTEEETAQSLGNFSAVFLSKNVLEILTQMNSPECPGTV